MNYHDLQVKDGTEAQVAWNEMIKLPTGEQKKKLVHDLEKYCGQDTWAMVEIHRFLLKGINE